MSASFGQLTSFLFPAFEGRKEGPRSSSLFLPRHSDYTASPLSGVRRFLPVSESYQLDSSVCEIFLSSNHIQQ